MSIPDLRRSISARVFQDGIDERVGSNKDCDASAVERQNTKHVRQTRLKTAATSFNPATTLASYQAQPGKWGIIIPSGQLTLYSIAAGLTNSIAAVVLMMNLPPIPAKPTRRLVRVANRGAPDKQVFRPLELCLEPMHTDFRYLSRPCLTPPHCSC